VGDKQLYWHGGFNTITIPSNMTITFENASKNIFIKELFFNQTGVNTSVSTCVALASARTHFLNCTFIYLEFATTIVTNANVGNATCPQVSYYGCEFIHNDIATNNHRTIGVYHFNHPSAFICMASCRANTNVGTTSNVRNYGLLNFLVPTPNVFPLAGSISITNSGTGTISGGYARYNGRFQTAVYFDGTFTTGYRGQLKLRIDNCQIGGRDDAGADATGVDSLIIIIGGGGSTTVKPLDAFDYILCFNNVLDPNNTVSLPSQKGLIYLDPSAAPVTALSGDFGSTDFYLYKNTIPLVSYTDPNRRAITKDNMIRAASTVVAVGLQKLSDVSSRSLVQAPLYGQYADLPSASQCYGATVAVRSPFLSQWFSNGTSWSPVTPGSWAAQFTRNTASISANNRIAKGAADPPLYASVLVATDANFIAVQPFTVALQNNMTATTSAQLNVLADGAGTYNVFCNVRFTSDATGAGAGTVYVYLMNTTDSTFTPISLLSLPSGIPLTNDEYSVSGQLTTTLALNKIYSLGFYANNNNYSLLVSNIEWYVVRA
jgi:hypothetical protein